MRSREEEAECSAVAHEAMLQRETSDLIDTFASSSSGLRLLMDMLRHMWMLYASCALA